MVISHRYIAKEVSAKDDATKHPHSIRLLFQHTFKSFDLQKSVTNALELA